MVSSYATSKHSVNTVVPILALPLYGLQHLETEPVFGR
jgi:hypothetical protein